MNLADNLPPVENMGLIKQLAHNDKPVRDKAMNALSNFLRAKCSDDYDEDEELMLDCLKLWKGLFYGMWMSDKLPVQLELAQAMAELVHLFPEHRLFLAWTKAFFQTIQREWYRIDKYRLDKYYSLVRKNLHEMFVYLDNTHWERELVQDFLSTLEEEAITQRKSTGLRYHMAQIYLEEFAKSSGKSVAPEAFQSVMGPFYNRIANSTDEVYLRRIQEGIFDRMTNCEIFFKETPGSFDEESGGDLQFAEVSLAVIADFVWGIASTPGSCRDRNRKDLYDLHKRLKKTMKFCGRSYQVTMQVQTTDPEESKRWEKHGTKVLGAKAVVESSDDGASGKRKRSSKKSATATEGPGHDDDEIGLGGEDSKAEEEGTVKKKRKKKKKKKVQLLSEVAPRKSSEDGQEKPSRRVGRPPRRVVFAKKNLSKGYKASIRDLRDKRRLRGSSAERPSKRGSGILK